MPAGAGGAARRGFDLSSEPPLRAHLFALGRGRARAAAGAASHCRRRLVDGAAGARSGALLCGAAWRAGRLILRRCRCNMPTIRCGSTRFWGGERCGQRDRAAACVLDARRWRVFPISSICRPTGRGLRWRAIAARALRLRRRRELHARACWGWRGQPGEPVHGAAGWACGAADAAGRGHRHPDRQPDCGSHRQRAGRSGRVLRQHAGAAHRHVGQSELPRADRRGCGRAILRPTATRIFRSSGWWRCSTRRARWRVIRCSR